MAKADRPLAQQLDELQVWLRTLDLGHHGGAPDWSRVLIGEDAQMRRTDATSIHPATIEGTALLTPEEFEKRWAEIVTDGQRDWINLSAHGIWRDALVVLVEAPANGVKGSYSPDQISINFSGPPLISGWDLSRHLLIV